MRKGLSASLFAVCLAMTAGVCAGQKPDPIQWSRFQEKIRRDITGISNYTCLETIARERRTPPSNEFKPVDTVRLEVSMVAGKELYSNPGHRFEDREVTSLVNSGAIGSGMFSMLVRNLFVRGRGDLRYTRAENLAGRRAVRYDFRLTRQESDLRFKVASFSEMVAARGSFWFDPITLDLVRLEIHGQDIPDNLHINNAVVRVDYGRARIGDSEALLPKRSELTMTFLNGVTYRDAIGFSQCHEYRAESTIAFGKMSDDPSHSAVPAAVEVAAPVSPSAGDVAAPAPVVLIQPPAAVEAAQPSPPSQPMAASITVAAPLEPPIAKTETVLPGDPVSFKSRVTLVMVPVVVRDREGHAVGNLRREDFQVFDKGKRQEIASFSVEKPGGRTVASIAQQESPRPGAPGQTTSETAGAQVVPGRFVAFVFDDVHLRFEDIVYVRDAAKRYVAGSLEPGDRAAIVTTSGHIMLDFASDRARLDAELQKLQPRAIARGGGAKRCPDISFYQADRLDREDNPNGGPALDAATYEVLACFPTFRLRQAQQIAIQMARDELTSGRFETRASLRVLRNLVERMSVLPVDRTILLVSPGFHLLTEHQPDETEVIDLAVRSRVVINALDARGLFELNPAGELDDRPQQIDTDKKPDIMKRMQEARYQSKRDEAGTSAAVMADLASGTGGRLIENTNDYDGAVRRLAAAPEYIYLLGFSPAALKPDGSLHLLKVRLTSSGKFNVQARRGYYAPQGQAGAGEIPRQAVEDALFSREEVNAHTLELHAQVAGTKLQVLAQFQGNLRSGAPERHPRSEPAH
jgi:VWFA-related protein